MRAVLLVDLILILGVYHQKFPQSLLHILRNCYCVGLGLFVFWGQPTMEEREDGLVYEGLVAHAVCEAGLVFLLLPGYLQG